MLHFRMNCPAADILFIGLFSIMGMGHSVLFKVL